MTIDYAGLSDSTLTILQNAGETAALTHVTGTSLNTSTNIITETTTSSTAKAVFVGFGANEFGKTFSAGNLVEINDKKILWPAGGTAPVIGDRVTRADGTVYRILGVKTVDPGGIAVIHILQGRI